MALLRKSNRRSAPGGMRALAIVVTAFALQAQASPPPDQPLPSNASSPAQSTPTSTVAPQLRPWTCDSYLPPGTNFPLRPGATLVSYRLTGEGEHRDVTLYRSSGSNVLDNAAIACASAMHNDPQLVNGKPVEVTEIRAVAWNVPVHGLFDISPAGTYYICGIRWYPISAYRLGQQGNTTISLDIEPDGSAKNVSVTNSSGFPAIDSAAVRCASGWHFFPIMQNSQPIEVERKFTLGFHLSD